MSTLLGIPASHIVSPMVKQDAHLVIRISGPLKAELEREAARDGGRPVTALARKVLVDWLAERIAARDGVTA